MVDAAPGAYAHALRREILRSEQKRMRAVAIVLVWVLCVASAAVTLLPDLKHRMFPDGIASWMPLAGIGPFILFELIALMVLRLRIAADKDFPRPARFVILAT